VGSHRTPDSSETTTTTSGAIVRAVGVTRSEKYLQRLCERAFLRLWSYPGLYRDQGKRGDVSDGKEVCDLLVVFENHILIFSDKSCEFRNTGRPAVDWNRWYKSAVLESAKQIWGAERWIREHPDRLFLDRACTKPFPYPLPDPGRAIFHRIVVAHNSAEHSRQFFGGSGSLLIAPGVVGKQHIEDSALPFAIGQIDPARGYVHVLDDVSLDIVLKTLDTISDFVEYLGKKEMLIESGKLVNAAGEEDLLAYYLRNIGDDGRHGFAVPPDITGITLDEGFWEAFQIHPQRLAQVEANKISYAWDGLIERFCTFIIGGTTYYSSDMSTGHREKAVRMLAKENRLRRRHLAKGFLGLIEETKPGICGRRLILPFSPQEPCYVFMVVPKPEGYTDDDYRVLRRNFLMVGCNIAKLKVPASHEFVGLAIDPKECPTSSEDLIYMDLGAWGPQEQAEAIALQEKTGLFTDMKLTKVTEQEFPEVPKAAQILERRPPTRGRKIGRNDPCPCGSGRKYKKCCLMT
jgi:hypothetical protein